MGHPLFKMYERMLNMALYELLKQLGGYVKIISLVSQTTDASTGIVTREENTTKVKCVIFPIDYLINKKWENHKATFRYGGYFSKDKLTIIIPYQLYGLLGVKKNFKLTKAHRVEYKEEIYDIEEFADYMELGIICTLRRNENDPS